MFKNIIVSLVLRPMVHALESLYTPVKTRAPRTVPGWQPDRTYYGLDYSWMVDDERLVPRLKAALRFDREAVSWERKRESLRLLLSAVSLAEYQFYVAGCCEPWDRHQLAAEQRRNPRPDLSGWGEAGRWQSELEVGK